MKLDLDRYQWAHADDLDSEEAREVFTTYLRETDAHEMGIQQNHLYTVFEDGKGYRVLETVYVESGKLQNLATVHLDEGRVEERKEEEPGEWLKELEPDNSG